MKLFTRIDGIIDNIARIIEHFDEIIDHIDEIIDRLDGIIDHLMDNYGGRYISVSELRIGENNYSFGANYWQFRWNY